MRIDLDGPEQGWISPHSNSYIENMCLSLFTLITPIVTVCLTLLFLLSVPTLADVRHDAITITITFRHHFQIDNKLYI